MKHANPVRSKVKSEVGVGEGGNEAGGVTPIVPEEVVTQLMDKPGAVRQHWRTKLRQQLSQRKAEERRQAEEVRRLYSEELPEDEEEGELTDGETTGQFVQ